MSSNESQPRGSIWYFKNLKIKNRSYKAGIAILPTMRADGQANIRAYLTLTDPKTNETKALSGSISLNSLAELVRAYELYTNRLTDILADAAKNLREFKTVAAKTLTALKLMGLNTYISNGVIKIAVDLDFGGYVVKGENQGAREFIRYPLYLPDDYGFISLLVDIFNRLKDKMNELWEQNAQIIPKLKGQNGQESQETIEPIEDINEVDIDNINEDEIKKAVGELVDNI